MNPESIDRSTEQRAPRRRGTAGRLWLSRSDQACVAVLATVAWIAIAMAAWSRGDAGVDLSRPATDPLVGRPPLQFQLDANRADWPEWTLLPRIGETLARRIVASRRDQGPFQAVEELERVSGIGPKTLELMRPYLLPLGNETLGNETLDHEI